MQNILPIECLLIVGHKKVYTYYWRVTNVDEKLFLWETGRSERSPIFYIGDSRYAMVLRITPRSFYNDRIFISGGLTKGEYDDKVVWPFLLQTQIEVRVRLLAFLSRPC